jgi:hypothetical protein
MFFQVFPYPSILLALIATQLGLLMRHTMSATNFEEIFYDEARKGSNLEKKLFPASNLARLSSLIQKLKKSLKLNKKPKSKKRITCNLYGQKDRKIGLLERKRKAVSEEMFKLEDLINDGRYKVKMTSVQNPQGKWIFSIERNDAQAFFSLKQLQRSLKSSYEIDICDRNQTIRQIKSILESKLDLKIFRTDVKSFFESIPYKFILEKLKKDNILPPQFIRMIEGVFDFYKNKTGQDIGIPRGLGISSYLAELYMQEFDKQIKIRDDVIYYARYVDDIILILSSQPSNEETINASKTHVENLSLSLNDSKTEEIQWNGTVQESVNLTFLGYQFCKCTNGKLIVTISENKIERYKKKIDSAILCYQIERQQNQKRAKRMLEQRIKLLTSNFRLINNKSNVYAGVYFSNIEITDTQQLTQLDNYLCEKLNAAKIADLSADSKLLSYKFIDGFNGKKFITLNPNKIKQLTSVWERHA